MKTWKLYSRMKIWNDQTGMSYGYTASKSDMENVAEHLDDTEDLSQYTSKSYDGFDKSMIPSIKLSVEGEFLVANIQIADGVSLSDKITQYTRSVSLKPNETTLGVAIIDWLSGQYSDGWGEGFEQRAISTDYETQDCSYEDEETGEWIEDSYDETIYYFASAWYPDFKFEKAILVA
jgi:hypothetical protein